MPWTSNEALSDLRGDGDPRPKLSMAAPALDGGVSSTFLLMVHLGNSSSQIWYATLQTDSDPANNHAWTADAAAGALRAEAAPAIAAGVMLFPASGSGRLSRASFSQAGWAVSDATPDLVDYPLHIRPSLAASEGVVHLVYKSPRSSRVRHSALLGGTWRSLGNLGDPDQGTYRSKTRPAIAVKNDVLHVLHLGEESNQIWHARGELHVAGDRATVDWRESPVGGQRSRTTPAVAVFGGRLHMVHLGDSSTTLWHSIYIDELNSWTQTHIPNQLSKAPPALAAFDGRLHLVHLGETSNQIWWSTWTDA